MTNPDYLTPKQANWFAKVREGLEKETGRTIDEWAAIARACPETTHRKRLKWLKEAHGLGVNRASAVLSEAFQTDIGWNNPEALLDNLWKRPELRKIYNAIQTCATSLSDDIVVCPRKSFSGFSRKYQFAAARPVKGIVRLGLAVDPTEHNLQKTISSDSWSDRLTAVVVISTLEEINESVEQLLKLAWETS